MKTLQTKLEYQFKDESLLRLALTHPSTKQPDNQRLEFLGDAVLAFCVSDMLYTMYPQLREGALTAKRALLVCERTLAQIAKNLDIGSALILGHGENLTGGRQKAAILADATEAIIAAMYVDGGLDSVKKLIEKHLFADEKWLYENPLDDKSALQEYTQANQLGLPVYSIIDQSGPDHQRTFTAQVSIMEMPIATGKGNSKKQAEMLAAKLALSYYNKKKEIKNATKKA